MAATRCGVISSPWCATWLPMVCHDQLLYAQGEAKCKFLCAGGTTQGQVLIRISLAPGPIVGYSLHFGVQVTFLPRCPQFLG